MSAAEGILTARGGMTSHAALVARQMGRVCVAGCGDLAHRLRRPHHDGQGPDGQGGRLDLDRRHDRPGPRGPGQHQALRGPPGPHREDARPGQGPGLPDLRQGHGLGRQVPDPQDPDQRRPARPVRQRRGLRGRGHRPVPDRAHVLRRGQDRPDARDDPGRHARAAQGRPGQAPAPSEARISPASSRSWPAGP